MAGGMNPGRGPQRRTLAERAAATGHASTSGTVPAEADPAADVTAADGVCDDATGRPCWVAVGARPLPGVVHAWRRDPSTGEWQALVVAWLPAPAVRPRAQPSR